MIFLAGQDLPGISAPPQHHEAAKGYAKVLSQLAFDGKLQMSPIKLFPNGLASVKEGLAYHKAGKVSNSLEFFCPDLMI
jgi:hypothetical protein